MRGLTAVAAGGCAGAPPAGYRERPSARRRSDRQPCRNIRHNGRGAPISSRRSIPVGKNHFIHRAVTLRWTFGNENWLRRTIEKSGSDAPSTAPSRRPNSSFGGRSPSAQADCARHDRQRATRDGTMIGGAPPPILSRSQAATGLAKRWWPENVLRRGVSPGAVI